MNRIRKTGKESRVPMKKSGKHTGAKGIVFRILTGAVITSAALIAAFGIYYTKASEHYEQRTSFDKGVAAKFGKTEVPMAQFMLYSVDIKNAYEEQYGDDIWGQNKKDAYGNNSTYEKVAKEDILEQIRFVWSVNKEGKEKNIKMSASEKKAIDESASDYYRQLIKAGISKETITEDDVKKFYEDNYYAQKAFYRITGVNTVTSSDKTPSSSSSTSSEDGSMSTEKAEEIWKKLVKKWYPDFDYNLDINWNLLDQISFSGSSASGDASKDIQEAEEKAADTGGSSSTESEDK